MTDEEKKVEGCKKCECCRLIAKFFFLAGAVFLGTFLALVLAHALAKPKFPPCHKGMMRPHDPGIERQLPPKFQLEQGRLPNAEGRQLPSREEFRGHRGLGHAGAEAPQTPQVK